MSEWNIRPTVEETLRVIRKLELLSSDAAKLLVMRKFAEKVLAYAERETGGAEELRVRAQKFFAEQGWRDSGDGMPLSGGYEITSSEVWDLMALFAVQERGPSSAEQTKEKA
jgi:hypothetical protein